MPAFVDKFPGAPRILFVGRADSAHTRSWIELLDGERLNVRLFSPPASAPPDASWPVMTYVSAAKHLGKDTSTRRHLTTSMPMLSSLQRFIRSRTGGGYRSYAMTWLSMIVRGWQPDIVHTLGLISSGSFYSAMLESTELETDATWVLQLWGGADLWCANDDNGVCRGAIDRAILACDQIFDDSAKGIDYARSIGACEQQIAQLGSVPGNGGIDLEAIRRRVETVPSQRRTIVWPKAYDSPWNRPRPVIDALELAWQSIGPVHVHILAASDDTRAAVARLPDEMQHHIEVHPIISRDRVLDLFATARVMLAPSLVDGVPNVMLEAMATGAMPIVSRLDTIDGVVNDDNVLFADNLDAQQIADAIVRAMHDDELVDTAARANALRVAELADRAVIKERILKYYDSLASNSSRTV